MYGFFQASLRVRGILSHLGISHGRHLTLNSKMLTLEGVDMHYDLVQANGSARLTSTGVDHPHLGPALDA